MLNSSSRCRVGLPTKNSNKNNEQNRNNSVGKPTLQRYDERDYDSSFGDGVWQSVKTSMVLSFAFPVFSLLLQNNLSLVEFIGTAIASFFYMGLITGLITLAVTLVFAYPTIIILRYLNLASEINAGLAAGFITFVFLMWAFAGKFTSFYYVIVFWGMACGYAFMRGYKKGEKQ